MPLRRTMSVARSLRRRPAEDDDELEAVADVLDRLSFRRPPSDVDAKLIQKFLPTLRVLRGYCRVAVDGLEHVPAGPAVLAANHTGWLGLDYANTATVLHDELKRTIRGVVHPLWFANPAIGSLVRRLGLVPVSKDTMVELLRAGALVMVFPEAEQGAFKPVTPDSLYRLIEFKRGFVRAALTAKVPIVPVAIVGGEEANPSGGTIHLLEGLFNLTLPVPRNVLPKPVKWRISFLKPLALDAYGPRDVDDRDVVRKIAEGVRRNIQKEIRVQLAKRGHKYL